MAALFSTRHPAQVRKQILLAPALTLPEFAEHLPAPIDVPTVIIQGRQDTVVRGISFLEFPLCLREFKRGVEPLFVLERFSSPREEAGDGALCLSLTISS